MSVFCGPTWVHDVHNVDRTCKLLFMYNDAIFAILPLYVITVYLKSGSQEVTEITFSFNSEKPPNPSLTLGINCRSRICLIFLGIRM